MRNFVTDRLPANYLDALLESVFSGLGVTAAEPESAEGESISVGLLAGDVEGLNPGLYNLDREKRSIGTVVETAMIGAMARVCLDQAWLANCALHFLFLTNLEIIERNRGPRGYRHALMKAGRIGQRIYLTATSMKIGCCGIGAFFDDEASQVLRLNDQSRLLYLVAVGPVKKWSVK